MVNSNSVEGEGSIVWKRLTERNRTRLIAVNLPWLSRRKPRQAVVLQQSRVRTMQIDRVWLLKADWLGHSMLETTIRYLTAADSGSQRTRSLVDKTGRTRLTISGASSARAAVVCKLSRLTDIEQ